ncbi:MAG TPA: oligosaccharide flippase family protein [Nocardioides sp.]|nr:oligosaccharide flippase family protein [Nocardioides sp.]
MPRVLTLGRGGGRLFAARLIGLAVATVSSLLLARILGPDDYGVYATAVAVGNLAVIFGPMGIDQLQLLHDLPESRAYRWTLLVAAASTAAGLVLALAWPNIEPMTRSCAFLMAAAGACRVALAPWLTTPQKQLRFDIRARRDLILGIFPSVGSVIAAVLATTVVAVVGVYLAILLVLAASAHWTMRQRARVRSVASRVRFRAGWPYAASAATYTLYFTADAAIIAATRTSQEVGQYKAAYMFITAATVLPIVLNNDMLRARLADLRDLPAESWHVVRRMAAANLGLGLAMTGGVCLLGPPAARLVYGAGFEQASELLTILGLALLPFAMNTFSGNALIAFGSVRLVLIVQVISCVANITANLVFVPAYGLDAAAYATVGTELLGATTLGAILVRRGFRSSARQHVSGVS